MPNYAQHSYHIVPESPWPLYGSIGGLFLTSGGGGSWFHLNDITLFFIGLRSLGLVMSQWWRGISREGGLSRPPIQQLQSQGFVNASFNALSY